MYSQRSFTSLIILMIVCLSTYKGLSQTISVPTKQQSLSDLLAYFDQQYGIQYSGNATLLSNCTVIPKAQYASIDAALEDMLASCNLTYKKIDAVFVIIEAPVTTVAAPPKKTKLYTFSGQVLDKQNTEPLPYANIRIQNTGITTDLHGQFSFKTKDSIVQLQISHLGYAPYYTTLKQTTFVSLELTPLITKLQEIVVEANATIPTVSLPETPNTIKINQHIASFLPSATTNSLFSILRLQPGIVAAGEQTRDYFIWGSYKGQSQIIFDDITIFNAGSFQDNIGAINPLIINDIELYKGGYNVHIGDRCGGVVNITSNKGNITKFNTKIQSTHQLVNGYQLINGYINIPLFKKSSLQLGLRTNVPDIFHPETYKNNLINKTSFSDFNIRYHYPFNDNSQLNISLIGNRDVYNNVFIKYNNTVSNIEEIENTHNQGGANISYSKTWKKWGTTRINSSFSMLHAFYSNKFEEDKENYDDDDFFRETRTDNTISEFTTKIRHSLPATRFYQLSFGLGYIHNNYSLEQDSATFEFKEYRDWNHRLQLYTRGTITVNKFFSIEPGIRVDFLLEQRSQPFIQPRLALLAQPNANWKFKLAYGFYYQFITESSFLDQWSNLIYHWNISSRKESHNVLNSHHYIGGLTCDYNFFSCKIEGYFKSFKNLSQFLVEQEKDDPKETRSNGRSYGIDILLQTKFNRQKFWVSYTWSRTEDRLDGGTYFRAPHDQRHEIKAAAVLDFKPFFVSVNYVYGSGFPIHNQLHSEENIRPYSRLDMAISYQLNFSKVQIETGLSVLNVLNTRNLRQTSLSTAYAGSQQSLEATPFSPSIFAHFKF